MFAAFAIASLICFAAGVVFHKYVLSEYTLAASRAREIKVHVTAEVSKLRQELQQFIQREKTVVTDLVEKL